MSTRLFAQQHVHLTINIALLALCEGNPPMNDDISRFSVLLLTLIILYIVPGFCGLGSVGPHDVIIHNGRPSEQREAARTTEHTAQHVFGSFLQPVTDGVLKLLVPYHRTWNTTRKYNPGNTIQSPNIVVVCQQSHHKIPATAWLTGDMRGVSSVSAIIYLNSCYAVGNIVLYCTAIYWFSCRMEPQHIGWSDVT